MNDTATRDPNISTRSMADVRRHRNKKVADYLRMVADRLERDDVQTCKAETHSPTVRLQERPGDEWERSVRQFGGEDDLTVTVSATIIAPVGTECPENHQGDCGRPRCPYCAWRCKRDTDGDGNCPDHPMGCPGSQPVDDTDPED